MQVILHTSSQETATGNGTEAIEPGLAVTALVISISQISINLLGGITFKVQHSTDGTNWFDIPNLATGSLTATGSTTVTLGSAFAIGDHVRVVWTFNNANSVTFTAFAVGVK